MQPHRRLASPREHIASPRVLLASPREVALTILRARYGPDLDRDRASSHRVFTLTDFQADAVARAERILSRWRGVIVADSVGLGKTFIALALIERALRDGERVGVFTPAALRGVWRPRLRRLRRAIPGAHLIWCSHARLSRGTFPVRRLAGLGLVVVDEAHAFRNARTRRYRALAGLYAGDRLILITATPVNNSVRDLYSLLRLFAGRTSFRTLGVPDLYTAFRAAESDPAALASVLHAVVIRRTRSDVRQFSSRVRTSSAALDPPLDFPERAPPRAIRYGLGPRRELYDHALRTIDALDFAALRWKDFTADENARASGSDAASARATPAELLRFLLLKRLESGLAAFAGSIARQHRFHRAFLDALGRGRLLVPSDHRALYGAGDDDTAQLVFERLALRELPCRIDRERLGRAAGADLERIAELRRTLRARDVDDDPKIQRLRTLLSREIGRARVVIFTAFHDTAHQLWRALLRERPTALITGAGAWLGDQPSGRRAVIRRFAPRANGAREPHPRERVAVLVATDVLAEGLDLYDAAHVISYDLPWNPVRLMQRVGRVDRLGSPHDRVRSYHFLPDDEVERRLGLLRRLREKVVAIRGSIGSEGAVLGATPPAPGESPGEAIARPAGSDVVDRLAAGDPDLLDAVERAGPVSTGLDERLRAAYAKATSGSPRFEAAEESFLYASVPVSTERPPRTLVALAIGSENIWLIDRHNGCGWVMAGAESGELLLHALRLAEVVPGSAARLESSIQSAQAALDARLATMRAGATVPLTAPAIRAAREIRRNLAAVPGGPNAELCARADRLLERLTRPQAAGVEQAVKDALDQLPNGSPGNRRGTDRALQLFNSLEKILIDGAGAHAPRAREISGRILGVLDFYAD